MEQIDNMEFIFNHDPEHVMAMVYGTVEKPEMEFVDIKN